METGSRKTKEKNIIAEKQTSTPPKTKKYKPMNSDENDEEAQNGAGTSSNPQPTVSVLPHHQGSAASSQGPAASAISDDEDSEHSDEYSAQSQDSGRTVLYPDLCVLTNDEHWAMTSKKHKYEQQNHFVFWLSKMKNHKTYIIWSLCPRNNNHYTPMRWPTLLTISKLKSQKELTVELGTYWNDVWRPAEEQQEWELKEDHVYERTPQPEKFEDTINRLRKQNIWRANPELITRVLILLIRGRLNREIMWSTEDGCSSSGRTNKVTSSIQEQDGYWEICKTNRRNTNKRIRLLLQDPDFGWAARRQPARVGTFFHIDLKTTFLQWQSYGVNRDVVCQL